MPARLQTSPLAGGPPRAWASALPLAAAGSAGAIALAAVVVTQPHLYRALFAVALLLNFLVMAAKWPRSAVVGLLVVMLPLVGLIRRLLIAESGWSSQDPLLLVAPVAVAFIVYRTLAAREGRIELDLLYKLVLGLFALALVEAFNPSGYGIAAGLAGLLFIAVPLLWFVVGRELGDRRLVRMVVYATIVTATISSTYGLWQTQHGFPSWDLAWIKVTGYAALHVGAQIRGFGTFPSSAEYAAFSGVGFVFAMALILHRRMAPIVVVPFMAVAIFLASGRSVLVLTLVAVVFMLAVLTRSLASGTFIAVFGVVTLFGLASIFGPSLDRATHQSSNALVSHQLGGLLNPLDPQKSTLIAHLGLVGSGFSQGLHHPFGRGTGVTNIAATKLSGKSNGTSEIDVTDAFISLGLAGGLMYLVAIAITFKTVIRRYAATRDPLVFAIAGLLVVTLGQWLSGGQYTVSSLTWFLIGWVTRPRDLGMGRREAHAPAAQPLAAANRTRAESIPSVADNGGGRGGIASGYVS